MDSNSPAGGVAFGLGGGGILGAHEVGMLRALAERRVKPDVILGTSIGVVNGACSLPIRRLDGVQRLARLWRDSDLAGGLPAGTDADVLFSARPARVWRLFPDSSGARRRSPGR